MSPKVALVLLFVLGAYCEFVSLPYQLTTNQFTPQRLTTFWTVGPVDFSVFGYTSNTPNNDGYFFYPVIEGVNGLATSALRTGSVFRTQNRRYTDQTNAGIGWDVSGSIYILTHSPIARYVLEFTPVEQNIETGVATRETTSFDVTFTSGVPFPAIWNLLTTSSGDAFFTTDDNWIIIEQVPPPAAEILRTLYTLVYFYQPVTGTQKPISIDLVTAGLSFSVPVETGKTRKLMFFVELSESLNDLLDQVTKFDQTFNIPPLLIADIPKDELGEISNFQFVDPINGIPLPATFTNLCKISSEVRDRSSARHPTKKHYFQQPWFC